MCSQIDAHSYHMEIVHCLKFTLCSQSFQIRRYFCRLLSRLLLSFSQRLNIVKKNCATKNAVRSNMRSAGNVFSRFCWHLSSFQFHLLLYSTEKNGIKKLKQKLLNIELGFSFTLELCLFLFLQSFFLLFAVFYYKFIVQYRVTHSAFNPFRLVTLHFLVLFSAAICDFHSFQFCLLFHCDRYV